MIFNLLLKNSLIEDYTYAPLKNLSTVTDKLSYELKLPLIDGRPFLFSCFALSIDGKLCYPDKSSGFSIANSNHHATDAEKLGDWWWLMMARSISDAVIIGSNSLKAENGNYTPHINIPELMKARHNSQLPSNVLTIIMSRNLDNLDLSQILFTNQDFQVIICCDCKLELKDIPPTYYYSKMSDVKIRSQLQQKNILYIDTDYLTMYQIFKRIGLNVILNESPYTHHSLMELQLLNEVWLNYSSSYIGGNITSLGNKQNSFNSINHPDTEILTLHHINYHFLYSRQKICYKI